MRDSGTRDPGVVVQLLSQRDLLSALKHLRGVFDAGAGGGLAAVTAAFDRYAGWLTSTIRRLMEKPDDEEARAAVLRARGELAEALLLLPLGQVEPTWDVGMSKVHGLLARAEVKLEEPSDAERQWVDALTDFTGAAPPAASADASFARRLLVAMLYVRPEDVTLSFDLPAVPPYLLGDYLRYLHEPPTLFTRIGQTDRYADFVRRWVAYLHAHYTAHPDASPWREAAHHFTQFGNFIPLYFAHHDLRTMYEQRGEILARVFADAGHAIAHTFAPRPPDRRRIRVGIVNGHFSAQTETYTTIPAFEHLDRSKFEVIVFAINRSGDAVEAYCQAHADQFVILPRELPQQVAALRSADLDVLITGSNVTAVTNAMAALLLHRLARIQCTNFGSPVTTGYRNMDVYISGTLSELPYSQAVTHYRERLELLDGTGFAFSYPVRSPSPLPPVPRSALNIPDDAVVFASGANFYKITPEVESTWLMILQRVPNARLLLYPFSPSWSNAYPVMMFMLRMARRLAERGLDADTNLVVLPGLNGREEVLRYLSVADVFLDSFPHGGSHSLYDALELGIPAVAMDGKTLRARQGAAMLRDLGMDDFVAPDEPTYITLATRLASDPALRTATRQRIQADLAKPTCFLDTRDYSQQIGAMLERLVADWREMKEPRTK